MPIFTIRDDREVHLAAREPLKSMFQLSPFVWRTKAGYDILVRAVNRDEDPSKKVARIYHGVSHDGLTFKMDVEPDISPGPSIDDLDGCEDPTVAVEEHGISVFYSGWNEARKQGKLLWATGSDACDLRKMGVALDSTRSHENPKEATIAKRDDGSWLLFFEYARGGRSRFGVASSNELSGPWLIGGDPVEARKRSWDSWHLSPGPIVELGENALMFYNGADHDAAWRIGWVVLSKDLTSVKERCKEPLITPPAPKGDETDIAFAASAILREGSGSECWLYYSIADKQMRRAALAVEERSGTP